MESFWGVGKMQLTGVTIRIASMKHTGESRRTFGDRLRSSMEQLKGGCSSYDISYFNPFESVGCVYSEVPIYIFDPSGGLYIFRLRDGPWGATSGSPLGFGGVVDLAMGLFEDLSLGLSLSSFGDLLTLVGGSRSYYRGVGGRWGVRESYYTMAHTNSYTFGLVSPWDFVTLGDFGTVGEASGVWDLYGQWETECRSYVYGGYIILYLGDGVLSCDFRLNYSYTDAAGTWPPRVVPYDMEGERYTRKDLNLCEASRGRLDYACSKLSAAMGLSVAYKY